MEMQQISVPQCAICGTTEQLLRCAKCKTAYYCSISHQHMDWPAHKRHCSILAKQKKNNTRMQQLQQMMSVATINLSNTTQPPTTTFPLANATQQSSSMQSPLMTMNGMTMNYYVENDAVANTNHNLSAANDPTMSVIYGATNQSTIPNEQDENMLVDPALMSQYYVDANTNNTLGQDGCQVLSTLVEPTQQQQSFQPTQQYEFQLPQPEQEQQEQLHQQQQQQTYAQFRNQNSQQERSTSFQIGQGDENVMANFNERRYEELCRNIINDMNQYGLSVVDDFLGVEKGMDVLGEVHDMYCAGVFQDGQLVNNTRTEQDLHKTIRGDKITWVKGVEPGCTSVGYLINQIDAVICRANSMHNNGKLGNYNIKERTKAMVACYPGSGSHYVTHVDNPNKDGRVITAIYYLNVDWDSKRCGGVLRIFPEDSNTVADIEPKFDRLIFFWSDKRNPHEVQPSHRTRYAITVWYFDANEREAALNRCKFGSTPKIVASSSKSTIHHLPPGFSKANENSNPNLNTNFNANSSQANLHQSEICT